MLCETPDIEEIGKQGIISSVKKWNRYIHCMPLSLSFKQCKLEWNCTLRSIWRYIAGQLTFKILLHYLRMISSIERNISSSSVWNGTAVDRKRELQDVRGLSFLYFNSREGDCRSSWILNLPNSMTSWNMQMDAALGIRPKLAELAWK